MKKIIQLTQPDASLTIQGIKDVAQIDARLLENGKRFYVYSTKLVGMDEAAPLELIQEVFNQQQYGNLAAMEDLPVNALLGFFDVKYPAKPEFSVWAACAPENAYKIGNAHIFDEPLLLSIEDVERLEGNLDLQIPSHQWLSSNPHLNECGRELRIQLSSKNYATATHGGSIVLELCGTIAICVEENMESIEYVTVYHGNESKSFYFRGDLIYHYEDEFHFNQKKYPSAFPPGFTRRVQLMLSFRYPKIDSLY